MKKQNGVENTSKEHLELNKKRKWKFIFGGLLVLIAIAIGLYVGYQKLNSNPISIYKNAINGIYNMLEDNLQELNENSIEYDILKDPMVINLEAKLNSNMSELKSFSGITYNIDLGFDYNKRLINLGLGAKENNSSIISAILSVVNDEVYVKSDELYNKIVKVTDYNIFDEMDLESNLTVNGEKINYSYEDINYILKKFKEILITSLDKDKFTMEEATIEISNKEYNAKKVIYNLDKENMERTTKIFVNSILKDEKLLKSLSNILGMSINELKEELQEEIDFTDFKDITIVLYTDKFNNIIAGNLFEETKELLRFESAEKFNLTFGVDGDKLIVQEEKDYYELKVYESNIEIMSFNIYENNDNLEVEYKFDIDGSACTGYIELNNVKVKNDKATGDFKFSIKVEDLDIKLDGKYSFAKAEVNKLDTTNSIKLEEISEEEVLDIYSKLGTILEKFGLSELMNAM